MGKKNSWFAAVLILECNVQGSTEEEPLVDHQIRLISAPDAETAYQRATFMGKSEEKSYKDLLQQTVRWRFTGLHDLVELDDKRVTDGTEVYSFRLRKSRSFPKLPKKKLTVFWLEANLGRALSDMLNDE